MQGKGGFLRILEAFIAIAIIAGAMSFIYVSQIQGPDQEESANQLIRIVLEKISSETDLRNSVLGGNVSGLKLEVDKFIPTSGELDYHFSICPLNEICKCDLMGLENEGFYEGGVDCPEEGDIFSDEISVSVTLDQVGIEPKVIRLFVWER
jgi:hypothetical protein